MRRLRFRPAHKAFTLVELVTAASLMTVMMLGVVEIFGIVAQTAGEAEGVHFAQQQMRALFDRLHGDVRGMSREGYLAIRKGTVRSAASRSGTYRYEANSAAGNPERYGADTLAFVTVGSCRDQMGGTPQDAASAEVVYTNYVKTPSRLLRVDNADVDPRRGVLGRGLWLLANGTSTNLWGGQSGLGYLCDLFTEENERIQTQRGQGGTAASPPPRILESSGAAADGAISIDPWLSDEAATVGSNPESLNRVMACCVSEFFVEAFTPFSMGERYFHGGDDAARTYRWSDVYDPDTDQYSTGETIESWPRAIRVTVAVHDPGETGDIPDGQNRFRGYAMQETFWIGDP